MKYLQLEAKRIMADMGYECSEKDIIKLANMFEERYDENFEPYYVWCDVIQEYLANDMTNVTLDNKKQL